MSFDYNGNLTALIDCLKNHNTVTASPDLGQSMTTRIPKDNIVPDDLEIMGVQGRNLPAIYARIVSGDEDYESLGVTGPSGNRKLKTIIYEVIGLYVRDGVTSTHETLVYGMGDLQLEVAVDRLKKRFGVEVVLTKPHVPYRETIRSKAQDEYRHKKQTGGRGQFGEVHIRMFPMPKDVNVEEWATKSRFANMKETHYDAENNFLWIDSVVGGTIPGNFLPAIEKGFRERLERGVRNARFVGALHAHGAQVFENKRDTPHGGGFFLEDRPQTSVRDLGSQHVNAVALHAVDGTGRGEPHEGILDLFLLFHLARLRLMRVVTLPAKIFFAVSCHVDPRDFLRALCTLCMAFATGIPVLHSLRPVSSWIHFMFLRHLVAHGTFETAMARENYRALYLCMASLTGFWNIGWFRVMRFVAGYTGFYRVMRV